MSARSVARSVSEAVSDSILSFTASGGGGGGPIVLPKLEVVSASPDLELLDESDGQKVTMPAAVANGTEDAVRPSNGNGWTSGKYYFEVEVLEVGDDRYSIGFLEESHSLETRVGHESFQMSAGFQSNNGYVAVENNNTYLNLSAAFGTVGAVVMLAIDVDNQKIWVGKDGSWYRNDATSYAGPDVEDANPTLSSADYSWWDAADPVYPSVSMNAKGLKEVVKYKYSESHFTYSIPSGFNGT